MLIYNDYLRNFRKKFNLTQKDVASYLNVSVRAVQAWEQGINPCSKSIYLSLKMYENNLIERAQCMRTLMNYEEALLNRVKV